MTGTALTKYFRSMLADMFVPTFETDKTLRPAVSEEQDPTLLLSPVEMIELLKAESFLELNLVFRHGITSVIGLLFEVIMPFQGYHRVDPL